MMDPMWLGFCFRLSSASSLTVWLFIMAASAATRKASADKYTIDNMVHLCETLLGMYIHTAPAQDTVELLRELVEVAVWGDKNDESVFDTFLERNMMRLLAATMENEACDPTVRVQCVQCATILLQNLTRDVSFFGILSNNFINRIMLAPIKCRKHPIRWQTSLSAYHAGIGSSTVVVPPAALVATAGRTTEEHEDEELMSHLVAFLKAVSLRLNNDTVQLFFMRNSTFSDGSRESVVKSQSSRLPLLDRALDLAWSRDRMVRTSTRQIFVNCLQVTQPMVQQYVQTVTPAFIRDIARLAVQFLVDAAAAILACSIPTESQSVELLLAAAASVAPRKQSRLQSPRSAALRVSSSSSGSETEEPPRRLAIPAHSDDDEDVPYGHTAAAASPVFVNVRDELFRRVLGAVSLHSSHDGHDGNDSAEELSSREGSQMQLRPDSAPLSDSNRRGRGGGAAFRAVAPSSGMIDTILEDALDDLLFFSDVVSMSGNTTAAAGVEMATTTVATNSVIAADVLDAIDEILLAGFLVPAISCLCQATTSIALRASVPSSTPAAHSLAEVAAGTRHSSRYRSIFTWEEGVLGCILLANWAKQLKHPGLASRLLLDRDGKGWSPLLCMLLQFIASQPADSDSGSFAGQYVTATRHRAADAAAHAAVASLYDLSVRLSSAPAEALPPLANWRDVRDKLADAYQSALEASSDQELVSLSQLLTVVLPTVGSGSTASSPSVQDTASRYRCLLLAASMRPAVSAAKLVRQLDLVRGDAAHGLVVANGVRQLLRDPNLNPAGGDEDTVNERLSGLLRHGSTHRLVEAMDVMLRGALSGTDRLGRDVRLAMSTVVSADAADEYYAELGDAAMETASRPRLPLETRQSCDALVAFLKTTYGKANRKALNALIDRYQLVNAAGVLQHVQTGSRAKITLAACLAEVHGRCLALHRLTLSPPIRPPHNIANLLALGSMPLCDRSAPKSLEEATTVTWAMIFLWVAARRASSVLGGPLTVSGSNVSSVGSPRLRESFAVLLDQLRPLMSVTAPQDAPPWVLAAVTRGEEDAERSTDSSKALLRYHPRVRRVCDRCEVAAFRLSGAWSAVARSASPESMAVGQAVMLELFSDDRKSSSDAVVDEEAAYPPPVTCSWMRLVPVVARRTADDQLRVYARELTSALNSGEGQSVDHIKVFNERADALSSVEAKTHIVLPVALVTAEVDAQLPFKMLVTALPGYAPAVIDTELVIVFRNHSDCKEAVRVLRKASSDTIGGQSRRLADVFAL